MAKVKSKKSANVLKQVLGVIEEIISVCRDGETTDDTFRQVLSLLKALIEFDAATIYVSDLATGQLREAASINGPVAILQFLTIEHGEGLTGWAADAGQPVLLADRSGHDNFDPAHDFASFMSVPLILTGTTIGVINLGSKTPGAYSEDEVRLLSQVAGQMAIAIENLSYRQELADLRSVADKLRDLVHHSQTQGKPVVEAADIKNIIARVNHDINNALAILLGNIQCMLMDKNLTDQNMVSRLRRMERALMKINEANHGLLELVRMTQPSENSPGQPEPARGKAVLTEDV